jgi:hypothetical protein
MHAGLSFSYSPISLLLRQPLSIKKSYAGAIQLRDHLLYALKVQMGSLFFTIQTFNSLNVQIKTFFSTF